MVTEDSAMMISEAISSGNLVTTIYPKVISPSRYDNQIQHYLNRGLMSRSSMEATISLDFNRKNSSALIEGCRTAGEKYNREITVVISTKIMGYNPYKIGLIYDRKNAKLY